MPVLPIGFPKYPSAFARTAAAYLALLAALFAGTDTAQAQQPPNNPATGTPAISGAARVGELLTVDTAGIADADGLTHATFSYDWLADDGPLTLGDLARIITTENVYRIRPDDVGLAIKVQVGFTDDAGNHEVLSSATTATVVASEPAPPENFSALPGEPGELDLEWDAPSFDPTTGGLRTSTIGDGGSPITSYTVQWREGTSSGCSNTSDVSEAVVASGTSYTIPALDHTLRYCVRVIATNAVGDSAPSAQLWRGPYPPPNKPATGAPTATGTLRVGEFVTADPSGIADEDGLTNVSYSYGWVLDPVPDPFIQVRLLYNKPEFLVPPDAAGRTIQVVVGFRDDLGHRQSLLSVPTAVVAPTFPDPPRNLAVAPGGPGALAVEWEAPVWNVRAWLYDGSTDVGDGGSPITSYTVQWREDTGSWSNTADVSEAIVTTGTTYTISGLDETLDYNVRVIATNAVGHGEPSADATATAGKQPPVVVGPTVSPGGGGGGGGPSPSVVDFEWNVTRDIDELGGGHDTPSGLWSDGATLWVLENGDGAVDAVYAYDLATGERVEDREFDLDERNRAPRGVWSDRTVIWVSDSGQEKLFAHLATGERLDERDIALADRNRDARGIWSDDETMWVLDGGKESLFAYDLASGESLAEYALDPANDDPRGLFFDGVTFWVSDHGEKRIFAYRLEAGEDGADGLERNRDEEFPNTVLSRAGNNSPRGLWSDGDVMYVADESDARIYTYNMPDAIDARLASLTLSGVDFGEFSPLRYDYASDTIPDGNIATLTAIPAQPGASLQVDPEDQDGDLANGRQVRLLPGLEITITVTSPDGSRERVYRLLLGPEEAAGPAPEEAAEPAPEEVAGPASDCLRGAVAVGFSLVVYAGGSIEDLVACAEGRNVTALYVRDSGQYVSYIVDAPELVNRSFAGLFADGVPALTPLITTSDGPATAAAVASVVTGPWATCLQGEIVEGFNLVVYEGGSVGELEACAEGVGLAALYVLDDGVWVSYILGAPEFVNRSFRELFTDGLPVATPLVGKRD